MRDYSLEWETPIVFEQIKESLKQREFNLGTQCTNDNEEECYAKDVYYIIKNSAIDIVGSEYIAITGMISAISENIREKSVCDGNICTTTGFIDDRIIYKSRCKDGKYDGLQQVALSQNDLKSEDNEEDDDLLFRHEFSLNYKDGKLDGRVKEDYFYTSSKYNYIRKYLDINIRNGRIQDDFKYRKAEYYESDYSYNLKDITAKFVDVVPREFLVETRFLNDNGKGVDNYIYGKADDDYKLNGMYFVASKSPGYIGYHGIARVDIGQYEHGKKIQSVSYEDGTATSALCRLDDSFCNSANEYVYYLSYSDCFVWCRNDEFIANVYDIKARKLDDERKIIQKYISFASKNFLKGGEESRNAKGELESKMWVWYGRDKLAREIVTNYVSHKMKYKTFLFDGKLIQEGEKQNY